MKFLLLLFISLALTGCFAHQPAPKPLEVTPMGVTVNGMDVGGLTPDQL